MDQTEEIDNGNSDSQSCSLPNTVEIQSMFHDWKKSPQQRLADLVEALTLSSALEEESKSTEAKDNKNYPSSLEKTVKEGINKSVSCEKQACNCHSNTLTMEPTPSVTIFFNVCSYIIYILLNDYLFGTFFYLQLNQEKQQILEKKFKNQGAVNSDNLKGTRIVVVDPKA